MTIKKYVMPHLASLLASEKCFKLKRQAHELWRRATRRPHTVDVFIHIADPYSILLVQVLAELQRRYPIVYRWNVVEQVDSALLPETEKLRKHSWRDANWLAEIYQLDLPNMEIPDDSVLKQANRLLAITCGIEQTADEIAQFFASFWQGTAFEELASLSTQPSVDPSWHFEQTDKRLRKYKHWMPGILGYGGETYWGLDRLDHLETRLNQLCGLSHQLKYNVQYKDFCMGKSNAAPSSATKSLTLYFSARSPYSYLALVRAKQLADHYQLTLDIRIVLPMVMRGLAVPSIKKMAIFHDTCREARKHNIPYGKVADPLGVGVENGYDLYTYADSIGKGYDLLLAFSQCVNALGVHADSPAGLQVICQMAKIDWDVAKKHIGKHAWRDTVERHSQEMAGLGMWGVPCIQYDSTIVWGQDRLLQIEQAIKHDLDQIVDNNPLLT